DLYRELARQRPDAFTPNLATSLIVLALRSEEAKGATLAVPFAHQAIQTLSPAFMVRPQAHNRLMLAMLKDYLRLCHAARIKPDMALLAPLIPLFQPPTEEKTHD
ncbi:MAG: hypothetical protein FD135_30, partial [Comamonadaceae bacterium]